MTCLLTPYTQRESAYTQIEPSAQVRARPTISCAGGGADGCAEEAAS